MSSVLGLDIGTNSVGSAWVDTDGHEITLGVTVFPAGVDDKRRPRAQKRREKRSLRRSIARRAARKRRLAKVLAQSGLLPSSDPDDPAFKELIASDPWQLRRAALTTALTPYEFGRVLVHLNQRRGWKAGIEDDQDEAKAQEKGKIKAAIAALRAQMHESKAETYGEFIADLRDERRHTGKGAYRDPVRNRRNSFEFHAERQLVRDEFRILWQRQASFDSQLAPLLTAELRDTIERVIFFQRRTYWRLGTLGRCDLEPTDRLCPKPDRHAQRFLMLETVNRIRIDGRPLSDDQRDLVIAVLSKYKTMTVPRLRKALGIADTGASLNIERERKPEINTDWFAAAIVRGVFGEQRWQSMPERTRESVNRAIQKFGDADEAKLRSGARDWWGLEDAAIDRLVTAWQRRPKGTVRLSRRAILRLLPHMEAGADVTTAKQKCGYPPHGYRLNKATRRFLAKHPDRLPPAPDLPNPIVRKAIHEVRRHVEAHLRKHGRKPDRIVVELARETKQTAKVRQARLKANREREAERQRIIDTILVPMGIEESQWPRAIDRVLLWQRQGFICPYTDLDSAQAATITTQEAALGEGVEVDHIVPWSRSFDNSLDNKILCRRAANRNKGDRTPKEWLTEAQFRQLEARLRHYQERFPRAWGNLHRDPPDLDGFVASQLTDTGYITRQVLAYLRETLYPEEPHKVLCTRGMYTAILRRDWGLVQGPKARWDHRHHALDAVVIALTDHSRLQALARAAQHQERELRRTGHWPTRGPVPPPAGWDHFREQVLAEVADLVVAHRPMRGITGALHEDSLYGEVSADDKLFTIRVPAASLTPAMLRPARQITDSSGRVSWRVGKGGVVRDPALRQHIRDCLASHGVDPDDFSRKQIADLAKAGKLAMPSGVPIRRVRLLRKILDPVAIPTDPRHPRFYIGGSNHHMEILADEATGEWTGRCVTTFEAARRLHPPRGRPKLPLFLGPHVQRLRAKGTLPQQQQDFYEGKRFVMALCKGETLYMADPETGQPAYFVVIKINPDSVEMVEHADARPSNAEVAHQARRVVKKSAGELHKLSLPDGSPPWKVRVTCLGDVEDA